MNCVDSSGWPSDHRLPRRPRCRRYPAPLPPLTTRRPTSVSGTPATPPRPSDEVRRRPPHRAVPLTRPQEQTQLSRECHICLWPPISSACPANVQSHAHAAGWALLPDVRRASGPAVGGPPAERGRGGRAVDEGAPGIGTVAVRVGDRHAGGEPAGKLEAGRGRGDIRSA